MTDEPRDYAAERLAARAAKYREQVARLRELVQAEPAQPDGPHDGRATAATDPSSPVAVLRSNVVPTRPTSNRPVQGDAS